MRAPLAATPAGTGPHRIAWIVSLALALIALLGFVRSAQAMPLSPGPAGPTVALAHWEDEAEEAEEAEDEEIEAGELEEGWAECEELEAGEEEEACEEEVEEAEELEELEECTLSEAEGTVTASAATNTVRVSVRYETYEPGPVTVHPRLRGRKGRLDLGRTTKRFSQAGVYREASHLNDAQMAKVLAAKQFTIGLRAPGSPSICTGLFDQDLRRHGARLTWR